ncbi:ATP-binding cassette domain-containing protein [Methylopila sp. 73B]|uniref:ATP-binding cassette domain-containing protein n=1 Tax=Methylopila sp. 73B TaxID=1120792 RepID=UPI000363108B|nr:ATP-binding cassette domain-containing protein [Methylopila sp. 73B]
MNVPLRAAPLAAAPSPSVPSDHILFEDVRLTYRASDGVEIVALDGVSFSVPRGGVVAVIGPSGAGKSSLLRLAEGRERPTAGRVEIAASGGAAPSVGVLAPHAALDPALTLAENLAAPLRRAGRPEPEIAREIEQALHYAGLDAERNRRPGELATGERRRAALARALSGGRDVLLLDEPTSALDPDSAQELLAAVTRASEERGATVLLATHDMAAVTTLAGAVVVIDQGRVVETGRTSRIFSRPEHRVTRRFAAAAPGAALPPFLRGKLKTSPSPQGKALLRLGFEGPAATRPVLTHVARELGFDLGIVAGSMGALSGDPFGVLIVAAPSDEPYFTAAVERLEDNGLAVETLGFVN